MSGSKRTSVPPKEWAKHLRSFGKKEFWSSVRNRFRSEEKEEMIQEIDPEELKRNKEEYETELRASLNGEDRWISEKVLEAIGGVKMSPEKTKEALQKLNELSKNGVQPLTKFKPVFPQPFKTFDELSDEERREEDSVEASSKRIMNFVLGEDSVYPDKPNPFLMPCPEPNQINPITPEKAREIFKDIRGRMGEPGPQSIDDLPHNEKLIPKVITIEVSGEVGTGKSHLLHYISKVVYERLGVDPICPELEVERNGSNLDDMPSYMLDDFISGRVIIQLKEKNTKPISFSHDCPCCD